MLKHLITFINYEKLIGMQANQQSFAPVNKNRKKSMKMLNRKCKTMGAIQKIYRVRNKT